MEGPDGKRRKLAGAGGVVFKRPREDDDSEEDEDDEVNEEHRRTSDIGGRTDREREQHKGGEVESEQPKVAEETKIVIRDEDDAF